MTPVEKNSIKALVEAIKSAENTDNEIGGQTAADFINALSAEPDEKKRRKMAKEFYKQRKNMATVLKNFEDVFTAEAEMALIKAAIGGTHTEKEVSYKGGKKSVRTKQVKTAPNIGALQFLLKNKMPDKYSDKPVSDVEIEDISEIEEDIYGDKK